MTEGGTSPSPQKLRKKRKELGTRGRKIVKSGKRGGGYDIKYRVSGKNSMRPVEAGGRGIG